MATKKKTPHTAQRAEAGGRPRNGCRRGASSRRTSQAQPQEVRPGNLAEWTALLAENRLGAAMALCRAVSFTTAPELLEVTPEQVGILKAMKIAVEYEKFLQKLEAEDRSDYSIGELADEVILPVWKL